STVSKLAQPGAFTDSLAESLRSGARALLARLGLEIGVLCEKLSNLGFVRDKRLRVVPPETLFRLGAELMNAANDPETGTTLKRASCYRDGLMIALLAARPLRRRNFARVEIGAHLVREVDAYWLRFDNAEPKTGEPIDAPFPDSLVPHLARIMREGWRV